MSRIAPLPPGQYRCRLLVRREADAGVEMLVEVDAGRCRSRRIRFVAIGPDRVRRARLLGPGDRVDVALRYRRGPAGQTIPVVPNFSPVAASNVVQVLGGVPAGEGGEGSIGPLFYDLGAADLDEEHGRLREVPVDVALRPAAQFPESLAAALRAELVVAESDCGAAVDSERAWTDTLLGRALERASQDHSFCLLRRRDAAPVVAWFDKAFAKFCRAEGLPADGGPVTTSVYQYGRDLDLHVRAGGEVGPDYRSPVWARWLHVHFRADGDPEGALVACRRFVTAIRRLGVAAQQVLVFTLGHGDLEVMFPSAVLGCTPRPGFEFVAGYICQLIADWSPLCLEQDGDPPARMNWVPQAPQPVDVGLYMPLAMVALPNTRVTESGCYKVRVSLHELATFDACQVAAIAAKPRPFNPPAWQAAPWQTMADINAYAVAVAVCRSQAVDQITFANRWIYPRTFDFLCFGASPEEMESRLFAAAMNLLDFACPGALLEALLSPAAALSGLPAAKVKATLANAIHTWRKARPLPIEPVSMVAVGEKDEEG